MPALPPYSAGTASALAPESDTGASHAPETEEDVLLEAGTAAGTKAEPPAAGAPREHTSAHGGGASTKDASQGQQSADDTRTEADTEVERAFGQRAAYAPAPSSVRLGVDDAVGASVPTASGASGTPLPSQAHEHAGGAGADVANGDTHSVTRQRDMGAPAPVDGPQAHSGAATDTRDGPRRPPSSDTSNSKRSRNSATTDSSAGAAAAARGHADAHVGSNAHPVMGRSDAGVPEATTASPPAATKFDAGIAGDAPDPADKHKTETDPVADRMALPIRVPALPPPVPFSGSYQADSSAAPRGATPPGVVHTADTPARGDARVAEGSAAANASVPATASAMMADRDSGARAPVGVPPDSSHASPSPDPYIGSDPLDSDDPTLHSAAHAAPAASAPDSATIWPPVLAAKPATAAPHASGDSLDDAPALSGPQARDRLPDDDEDDAGESGAVDVRQADDTATDRSSQSRDASESARAPGKRDATNSGHEHMLRGGTVGGAGAAEGGARDHAGSPDADAESDGEPGDADAGTIGGPGDVSAGNAPQPPGRPQGRSEYLQRTRNDVDYGQPAGRGGSDGGGGARHRREPELDTAVGDFGDGLSGAGAGAGGAGLGGSADESDEEPYDSAGAQASVTPPNVVPGASGTTGGGDVQRGGSAGGGEPDADGSGERR